MLTSAKCKLRKTDALTLTQCATHCGHSPRLQLVFWDDEVWALKICGIDCVARNKMLNRCGPLSRKAKALEVRRLDDKVFALLIFKSFGHVLRFDGFIVRGDL